MKILQILAMVLCLSAGYVLPTNAAPDDSAVQMQKTVKGPRHHRAMSKAMMEDLNLSAEQKAQWKKLSEQKKKEITPLREQMNKLHEQERRINEKYENEVIRILTPAQAEKYKSMLPRKPEMPKKRNPKK